MRIKRRPRTDLLIKLLVCAIAAGLFATVGYLHLFYNPTPSVQAKASAQAATVKSSTNGTSMPQSYYGHKRVEIALAEYNKNVTEKTHNCHCGKEIDKYTEGVHSQWCTMFASWVTREAGSPMVDEKTEGWRIINSREFMRNLQKNGTWHSKQEIITKNLKPEPGDFIIFWRGDYDNNLGHVDIVAEPETSDGSAMLVGGNISGTIKYRKVNYMKEYGFLGFGHPEKN